LKILIACEKSGRVREAFRKRGHQCWSVYKSDTTIPSEFHIQADEIRVIEAVHWDMLIAFPPCTYLTYVSGRWTSPNSRDFRPEKAQLQKEAVNFVRYLMSVPIPRVAIENPVGVLSSRIRKPDQYVHPYWFGSPHSKKTCLWLKGLPLLKPTNMVTPNPRSEDYVWYLKTLGLPPVERSRTRALMTVVGLDEAMAEQWGNLAPV
jgi:hypothetical protein